MKSSKSQKIPMFFFRILKDGAKHYKRYLSLNPPFDLNCYMGTAGTGSNILNTNHMFPNPVSPFTYPLTSLRLKFQNFFTRAHVMYGFLRDLSTGVLFMQLCMDVGSQQQHRKSCSCVAGIKLASGK